MKIKADYGLWRYDCYFLPHLSISIYRQWSSPSWEHKLWRHFGINLMRGAMRLGPYNTGTRFYLYIGLLAIWGDLNIKARQSIMERERQNHPKLRYVGWKPVFFWAL